MPTSRYNTVRYEDRNNPYSHVTQPEGHALRPYGAGVGYYRPSRGLPGIRSWALNLPIPAGGWGPRWTQGPDGRWHR